jgi:hypothetical protein
LHGQGDALDRGLGLPSRGVGIQGKKWRTTATRLSPTL